MDGSGIVIQPVGEGNFEACVQFLTEWVSDGEAEARRYLAYHAEPEGASLVAMRGRRLRRDRVGVQLCGVPGPQHSSGPPGRCGRAVPAARRATLLMDATEQLARERGVATLGITVGLFDEYGPAQRLYGRRGYIPDGRGACRGQRPVSKGMAVTVDDDLIMWLTKDLVG